MLITQCPKYDGDDNKDNCNGKTEIDGLGKDGKGKGKVEGCKYDDDTKKCLVRFHFYQNMIHDRNTFRF